MWKAKTLMYQTRRSIVTNKPIRDSLKLSSIQLPALPKLTNFAAAKKYFGKKVLEGNRELDKAWVAPYPIANAFRTIFPEIVESRGITKLHNDAFYRWDG